MSKVENSLVFVFPIPENPCEYKKEILLFEEIFYLFEEIKYLSEYI
jgi:hypothetical protein